MVKKKKMLSTTCHKTTAIKMSAGKMVRQCTDDTWCAARASVPAAAAAGVVRFQETVLAMDIINMGPANCRKLLASAGVGMTKSEPPVRFFALLPVPDWAASSRSKVLLTQKYRYTAPAVCAMLVAHAAPAAPNRKGPTNSQSVCVLPCQKK